MIKLLRIILQKTFSVFKNVYSDLKCLHMSTAWPNFKWFLNHNPPMVMFTFNVAVFALILTSLGYYVNVTDTIETTDVWEDWNMFLESFSKLELCIKHTNKSVLSDDVLLQQAKEKPKKGKQRIESVTHSFPISLSIQPTKDFLNIPHSITHLSTDMLGKYIGLEGDESQLRLNVALVVPYNWTSDICPSSQMQSCGAVHVNACIQFTGPNKMFPKVKHSKACQAKPVTTGLQYFAKLNWQMPDVEMLYYCRSRTMIQINYKKDPTLSKPIQKILRSVIKVHLMRTSFFLSAFVVVVFLYAVFFSHAKSSLLKPEEEAMFDI